MGVKGIEYGRKHEKLEKLLKSVDRPGDYCVGGRLFVPMPRISVAGVGGLSFPLPDEQVRALIDAARRAPYGRGTETLVDTSVRDCRQIDGADVDVAGQAWPDSFAKLMTLVAAGLGLPDERLGAELYKLLVYRPGGFFKAHRDTEKVAGMVGTLSVSLPVAGSGGDLVVRHDGRETIFDMSAEEPSELAFSAFYADCVHEVLPLTEGHRVSLVFNLVLRSAQPVPQAPDHTNLVGPVAEYLAKWRERGATDKLVWLLDHEYSEDGLSLDTLKNTDAVIARVLGEAADQTSCELHAAVLRIEEYGLPEFEPYYDRWDSQWHGDDTTEMGEVHDSWCTLDGWAARDGSRPSFGRLPLDDSELLPRGALDDAEPDERRIEGSTGNEGATLELTYRSTALVVWPRDRTVDIVAEADIDEAVSWVATRCARADDAGGDEVRHLLARVTELWPVDNDMREKQDRAAMLRLLSAVGDANLAREFMHRVVAAKYDGTENEALADVMSLIGPEAANDVLPGLVEEHLPRRPRYVIGLLALMDRT